MDISVIIAVVIAVVILVIISVTLIFSKKKKHWQIGYKTLREDMLPKREKNYQQTQTSNTSNISIWGQTNPETPKEETKTENNPIFPPGMFD